MSTVTLTLELDLESAKLLLSVYTVLAQEEYADTARIVQDFHYLLERLGEYVDEEDARRWDDSQLTSLFAILPGFKAILGRPHARSDYD